MKPASKKARAVSERSPARGLCDENEALILLNLSQVRRSRPRTSTIYKLGFSNQLSPAGCNRQNTSSWKHGFMLPMLSHRLSNQANEVHLRTPRGFLSLNISTRLGHASILPSFLKESALNRTRCRLTGRYRSRTIR